MGPGDVQSHLSMDDRVTFTMPDTGFVFPISFLFFTSENILIFLAQLCPAIV
jgi:hypothetical protein